jgi:hypothetical protein
MEKMVMKKINLCRVRLLLIAVICMLLIGCGKENETENEVKEDAEKIIHIVESNDMDALEQLLMGENKVTADAELLDFFSTSESGNNGIITKIVTRDAIKIKKIKDESVIYIFTAPDLSSMFQDAMKEENLTDENFEKYIYNYIDSADETKIEVEVSYTYENNRFEADYYTEEFANAMTGGMISSYQNLIQEVIKENEEETE